MLQDPVTKAPRAFNTAPIMHAFSSGIETMYDDAHLSDVVLKAENTKIYAHKVVLASQSPAFKAMFQVLLAFSPARLS